MDCSDDQTPILALRPSSCAGLYDELNKESTDNTGVRYFNNYIGAAELAGFSSSQIKKLKNSDNPTETFIQMWCEMGPHVPKIGDLWKILLDLGRKDILQRLSRHIHGDIEAFKRMIPFEPRDFLGEGPPSYDEEEMKDINLDRNGQEIMYDAYATFNLVDEDRALKLALLIEQRSNLRLFISSRDMQPGVSKYPAQAYIIEKRCRKVLLFITKEFTSCPSCMFIVRFTNDLAPDGRKKIMIPILLDKVDKLPSTIDHLSTLNISGFEGQDIHNQTFWARLAQSFQRKQPRRAVDAPSYLRPRRPLNHAKSLPQGTEPPAILYHRSVSDQGYRWPIDGANGTNAIDGDHDDDDSGMQSAVENSEELFGGYGPDHSEDPDNTHLQEEVESRHNEEALTGLSQLKVHEEVESRHNVEALAGLGQLKVHEEVDIKCNKDTGECKEQKGFISDKTLTWL